MQDLEIIIKALSPLGPTVAAAVAVLAIVLRTIWPYFRDTYLPERLAAAKEQAQAWKQIAEFSERSHGQLVEVRRDIADVRQDIAALYERKRAPRPSRRDKTALILPEGARS